MNVSLRQFEECDIPNKVRWINDENNNRFLHYDLPLSEEKTFVWFRANLNRTDRYDAVIECDGVPVGIIGLLTIADGKAEYYVTLGESEAKGKGIAKQATLVLLKYAFEKLGLKTVYLYTEVNNLSAQKLFERCGFCRKGIEKDSAVNRGVSVDRYYYEISCEDMEI